MLCSARKGAEASCLLASILPLSYVSSQKPTFILVGVSAKEKASFGKWLQVLHGLRRRPPRRRLSECLEEIGKKAYSMGKGKRIPDCGNRQYTAQVGACVVENSRG